MPLTTFQRMVLGVIAKNRNLNSYVAGGTLLNRSTDSPRISKAFDLFHEAEEAVGIAWTEDSRTLRDAGFIFEPIRPEGAFRRAVVSKGSERMKLEWAMDSAFRFFPVQRDPEFGFALHVADAATNKVLALAGRFEARDFIDVLYLHEHYASFGLLVWAAVGKDPGFTPDLLIEECIRLNRVGPWNMAEVLGSDQFDWPKIKAKWLQCVAEAKGLAHKLPSQDLGCLYLNDQERPVNPMVAGCKVQRRFGSIGGSVPRPVEGGLPLEPSLTQEATRTFRDSYGR